MRTYLCLLLLSCRATWSTVEVQALPVPTYDHQHVFDAEYDDNVPICDRGPHCDEVLFFDSLGACQEREGAFSRQKCSNEERSHYEWCTAFHVAYDDACQQLRPGNIPGPQELCRHTCATMAGAMNNYECANGSHECISHTHYWRQWCERDCEPERVITTWGH